MAKVEIDSSELEVLKKKSEQYDKISNHVDSAYEFDEQGNAIENGKDLCTIGEFVCSLLGYL